jgi:hypothetical protein
MKVFLTGGLGNQLFQLAAAVENSQGKIELISKIGNPRLSEKGDPEISSFDLPDYVTIQPPPVSFKNFTMKVIGLNLRSHFNPKKLENSFLWVYRSFGNLYLSVLFKGALRLRVGRDVGFTPIGKLDSNDFLVGYFQSFKYLSKITLDKMSALRVLEPSRDFHDYLGRLQDKRILVVHVRLGDYMNEPKIGTLSQEYYQRALQEIDLTKIDQILVFSDSPELIKGYLPKELSTNFEIVPKTFTSAETLMLMKTGSDFIISNSTFSWWGAMLSQNRNKRVIAPTPWFVAQDEPKDLLPSSWIKVRR